MRFSILIPSWNNLELLQCCIRSIQKHSSHAHEILIHLNEGVDGSLEWVQKEGFTYTHSTENIGICRAMNTMGTLATTDYLVYMNDDMVVLPRWDERLATWITRIEDQPFMLSATLVEPRESGNACVVVADFGRTPETLDEQGLINALPTLARPDWWGSTWPPLVMRKQDWIAVGGFSEEFSPGMSSDNDLSMKLWQLGCRQFIGAGDALVYHFMSKSTGKVKRNNGRKTFLEKWGITHSVFDRYYLRRGTIRYATETTLPEPQGTLSFYLSLLRCWLKRKLS
jgi:GT2 family glycosyltransferase